MGRKRTAEELNRTANNNGFVAGAYEEEDLFEQIRDEYSKRYIKNQDESLDLWRVGVSAAECLYMGCPPPTNVIVKEFARWYCVSRSGRIEQRPNLTSVKNLLKKLFSGFTRVTGTALSDGFRIDIYTWVKNTLAKQGFTTTKKRDKFLFDVDDLVNVIVCAWTKDDSVFIHECMRVQMTFLILVYCFSGARIGAFLHNGKTEAVKGEAQTEKVVFEGLVWKDVLVHLLPLPNGTTEVVLKIVQRWVKNNKDPENTVSEVSTYQHQKLRFDVAAFLLALAFRDDVFDGISSPAQLWEQRVPEGDTLFRLRMKPQKLNLPVLRTITRHGGLSDRMLDDSTFRYHFQRIVVNAGYYGNLTIHALRRALANAVDSELPFIFSPHCAMNLFNEIELLQKATSGERNQLLGHASSGVFNKHYISTVSSVDGQAAFLREDWRADHIAKLRSVSTQRAQGLPQRLPAERTAELLKDPTVCELHRRLCDLRENSATTQTVEDAKREFKTYRYWLNKRALEKYKEDWLEARYQQIIQTGGKASYDKSTDTSQVQALFRIMPERARLADMINSNEPCTRDQKLLAVQDLLSLCNRDYEVMYRPGEEPINGTCPVCCCLLPKAARVRSDHIHACRRKEIMESTGRQSSPPSSVQVQYCYLCFKWFEDNATWDEHCFQHILSMKSKWCGLQKYCHTTISPGYCPFCLGDEGLTASDRLRAWTRNCTLMNHVDNHINGYLLSSSVCPHPLCDTQLENASSLRHHLGDAHGLSRANNKSFSRKTTRDNTEDLAGTPDPEIIHKKKQAKTRVSRNSTLVGSVFIDCSPSIKSESCDQLIESRQSTVVPSPAIELDEFDSPDNVYMDLCTDEVDAHISLSRRCYPKLNREDPASNLGSDEDRTLGSQTSSTISSQNENVVERNTDSILVRPVDDFAEILNIPLDPALFSLNDLSVPVALTIRTSHAKQTNENDLAKSDSFFAHNSDLASDNININEQHRDTITCNVENSQSTFSMRGWEDVLSPNEITIPQEEQNNCFVVESTLQDSLGPKESDRTESKCPICGSNVPLRQKRRSKPMSLRQQMAFCNNHKRMNAETEWAQRGYPRIAWRRLSTRMEKYTPVLLDIIMKEDSPSFYRSMLKSAVDRNEKRNDRCMENVTAGYYGPRGQQIMEEHIVAKLGAELRQRAVTDHFMRIIGVPDFVLIVLVPELAMMLIKEDMKVCDEMARKILRESTRLGQTLNDDC